jgi:hypothetical protein
MIDNICKKWYYITVSRYRFSASGKVKIMVLGSLVSAPYGKCPGFPALVGVGQVGDRINHRGFELVKVRPVKGLPFEKWFQSTDLQPVSLEDFLGGETQKASA